MIVADLGKILDVFGVKLTLLLQYSGFTPFLDELWIADKPVCPLLQGGNGSPENRG